MDTIIRMGVFSGNKTGFVRLGHMCVDAGEVTIVFLSITIATATLHTIQQLGCISTTIYVWTINDT